MADTADLKSVDRLGREGSSPSSGTNLPFMKEQAISRLHRPKLKIAYLGIFQGPLAQSVEHLPRKQAVLGSTPGRPSKWSVGVTPKIAHPV